MIVDFLQDVIGLGITAFGLFVLFVLAVIGELGFRLGLWRMSRRKFEDKEVTGVSTLTGGMLGLMAFMLALSISFSQDRFESRRHTTVDGANTIGTAWLRAGLAGPAGQPIAKLVKDYAETRLEYLQAATPNSEATALARTSSMQNQIWAQSLPLLQGMPAPLAASLVSSLNDMFDASLVQRYAIEGRVPLETSLMLLSAALLAVGALGYQMGISGHRQYVLALLLLLMISGGMMLIIDMSRPRLGFTRIDTKPLVWTIQGFAATPKQ